MESTTYLRKRDTVEATIVTEDTNVPQDEQGNAIAHANVGDVLVTAENGLPLAFPKVYDRASFERLFEVPRERAAEVTPTSTQTAPLPPLTDGAVTSAKLTDGTVDATQA